MLCIRGRKEERKTMTWQKHALSLLKSYLYLLLTDTELFPICFSLVLSCLSLCWALLQPHHFPSRLWGCAPAPDGLLCPCPPPAPWARSSCWASEPSPHRPQPPWPGAKGCAAVTTRPRGQETLSARCVPSTVPGGRGMQQWQELAPHSVGSGAAFPRDACSTSLLFLIPLLTWVISRTLSHCCFLFLFVCFPANNSDIELFFSWKTQPDMGICITEGWWWMT